MFCRMQGPKWCCEGAVVYVAFCLRTTKGILALHQVLPALHWGCNAVEEGVVRQCMRLAGVAKLLPSVVRPNL